MDKDLTPEEVEALSKAMGPASTSAVEEASAPRITRAQFLPLEELSQATELPKKDLERAYDHLIYQWLNYMHYTKKHYPYYFVFALRTNPFNKI